MAYNVPFISHPGPLLTSTQQRRTLIRPPTLLPQSASSLQHLRIQSLARFDLDLRVAGLRRMACQIRRAELFGLRTWR